VTPRGDEPQMRPADTDALVEFFRTAVHRGASYLKVVEAGKVAADAHAQEREAREQADESFKGIAAEMLREIGELQRQKKLADAQVEALREKAKTARAIAAAPDYDEEAIRAALWAVVDEALASLAPQGGAGQG